MSSSAFRVLHALRHPYTRTALRGARTLGLAASIGFAGYSSGIHDALADPEGTTKKILTRVLAGVGGGPWHLIRLTKFEVNFIL